MIRLINNDILCPYVRFVNKVYCELFGFVMFLRQFLAKTDYSERRVLKNKNMQEEIWKDIIGYENFYQVSNLGRVRSLDRVVIGSRFKSSVYGKILANRYTKKGYVVFILQKNGKKTNEPAHRLVAKHFIPNPENKKEVNHINLIKDDNRVENLEWCTRSENMKHAGVNGKLGGTKGMFLGSNSCRSKLVESDVIEIRRLFNEENLKHTEIQKIFPQVGRRHLTDIINRVYWTHI